MLPTVIALAVPNAENALAKRSKKDAMNEGARIGSPT
jgi:hypothetical protein